MKKVFFFDIDGTLLPHGNEKDVDAKTIYALNCLKAAGHDVVIATGKSEAMIQKTVKSIGATNHITMNGAQVVVDNEVKHIEKMSIQTLERIKSVAREYGLMLGCQTRDEYYLVDINYNYQIAEQILSKVSLDVPPVKADFNPADTISQLWFLGKHDSLDLDAPVIDGHKLLKWHPEGVDIVIDYVSKAFAIEKYLELQYPNTKVETYAFGDGQNDIEMLECVDIGIAMANGVDELKKVAKHTTDSCENLGVYNYLVASGLVEEM